MKRLFHIFFICVLIACSGKGFAQITSCNFLLHDTSVCSPVVLIATANEVSNSPIVARVWYITTCAGTHIYNTTGTALNSNFSYVLTTPGCYCLRMWSKNQNGDTCSYQKCNITVAANPTPNFTFSPVEGCIPFTVSAQCNSTAGSGTIDSVVIDWGCYGLTFNNSCPTNPISVTYAQPACAPGIQSPTVIIKNTYGCFAEMAYPNLISLIPDPVANFIADTTTANCTNSPLTVHFTADSADPHITYSWFINGAAAQTGSSRFLTYTFPLDSNCYNIKLVVSHPSGCSDSITKSNYICVRSSPSITFTQNSNNVCINAQHPDSLILTNTSQGIPNLTWQLTSVPAQTFAPVYGARAAFNITLPGTYTVTANGVYAPGCSKTITRQVLVANSRPSATYTQNDSITCKLPFTVSFNGGPCAGCTYFWGFPGGSPTSSHAQDTTITFNSFGNSNVALIETDPDGCKDTIIKVNDIIRKQIHANFLSNHLVGCAPLCVTLKNSTSLTGLPAATIATTCWSFPNSSITGVCRDTFSTCFAQPGCYNVKMVTTTNAGCTDSILAANVICVANPPVNSITATPAAVCYHDTVHFQISGDTITTVSVKFGDGSPARVFNTNKFTYVYTDTGQFCVAVITFRDSCKGDSLSTCVTINPPIAKFTDSTTCRTGDTIFLNNQSAGATSYKWYFCNGDSSTLKNPYEILPYCDTCTVRLYSYNGTTGCRDKMFLTINTACDSSSFNPIDTQGCAPLVIRYTNTSHYNVPGFTAWDWDCSNGINWSGAGSSPGNTVSHTFTAAGTYCIAMRNESAGGCIDTVYGSVHVCKLTANFATNASCFPAPFCFIDSSIDQSCGGINWRWSFGDATTSTLQNPCHVYPAPGTYQVKFFISNATGCKDSITKSVIISSPVNVNLNIDTNVCPGVQRCVNNNTTGVALVYSWTMPGATPPSSTSPSPCYTYNNPGDFPVYLHLSSNNLCAFNDTFMVHAHSPVAGGYASSTYISCPNPPQLIVFYDTSHYTDTLWHWNFGDSSFSNQQNASHIYIKPGVYVVTETVTDKSGCTNTAFIDTIRVAGPYGTVNYTPSAGVCACKKSAHFTISTSGAINVILLYGCNSGFTQIAPNPIGTDSSLTVDSLMVPYCLTDSCRTKVIVDDATGCQVFLPDLVINVDSPVVKIGFNNQGICIAGTVCFYDSTSYHFDSPISFTTSRLWDFGDGTTDTTKNPCHYYAQPGVYNVRLYIHSNMGCFDSIVSKNVVIPHLPVAGYYSDTSFACAYSPICFHDTSSTDSITGRAYTIWDFGDGSPQISISRNICHTYSTPGLYRIKMCVFDSIGCSNCDSAITISVIPNPVANAGGNQTICYGIVTQLNGVGGINYHWSPPNLFSNPNISNPTVLLFHDTVVTFTVSNNFGCTNTDTIGLTLARVFADFNVGHTFCLGNTVCVKDTSSGIRDSIITYDYSFGDGHVVSGADNCHIYANPGSYNISLIDIDNHGCVDSITKPVIVFPSPEAIFSISDTVICSNQQICLTDHSTATTQITNWLWNYGDNSGSSLTSPPCHTYTAPFQHTYTISLIVTDQNNCSDSAAIIETVNTIPRADFSWVTSCEDAPMPLSSTTQAGNGNITSCQWVFWLGASNPAIDSNCNTSYQFPPGIHSVQLSVTDINGCRDTIVQNVITDSLTQLTLYPGDTTICLGSSIDYSVNGVFNHVRWMNYIWISNPNARLVTINPLGDITYSVRVQNGACGALSDSFNIHVIQPIPIEVNATPQQIVLGLTSNITSQIAGQIDSIVWTPDSTLDCRDCPNPVATPKQTTTYIATIYYTQNGISCSNSAEVTIDVLNSCDNGIIYVPNTFTPNGDGLNDIFMIRGLAATKINYFRILDRWGKMVFEADGGAPNDPQFGWDGTDRQGRKLNPDVYVYTYEIQCINGNIVTGQGNVTLVR